MQDTDKQTADGQIFRGPKSNLIQSWSEKRHGKSREKLKATLLDKNAIFEFASMLDKMCTTGKKIKLSVSASKKYSLDRL